MINNFNFKKSLGQNFLRDNNIIDKIVEGASIDKDTLTIEIGPGDGAISSRIIPKSGYAILYEIDERLKEYLEKELQFDNYKIIFGDFLKSSVKKDIESYSYKKLYVVANLPYYITTPIITKLIDDEVFPNKIVIMIQKEVADRFSAKPRTKDYGSLTVFLNYYYNIYKLCDVSRNCFEPIPNVDSSVIVMELKENNLELKNKKIFLNLVRDGFKFKRKNIKNNLSNYNLNIIEEVLSDYGFNLTDRAEMLSVDIFVEMANRLCD